jgi:esterase/lipase superfamily enzyme
MENYFFITNRRWSEKEEKYDFYEMDNHLNCGQFLGEGKMDFFKDPEELLAKLKPFKKILTYLHGMNYTFEFAGEQFSEYVTLNTDEEACFLLFAWSTVGEYFGDRMRAKSASTLFTPFLKDLCSTHPKHVHVLCHSMGGYVLWKALGKSDDEIQLGKVFFMASDVKKSHVKKRIDRLTKRTTLVVNYSYKYDLALFWSRWVSLMKTKIGATTVSGFENVNVHKTITCLDTRNSHTYLHHRKVIEDILIQILNDVVDCSPKDRGMLKRKDEKAYILK